MTSTRRTAWVAGGVVAVVAAIALALVVGLRLGSPSVPADDSADAGFLRDMQTHHGQAVEMSMIVRDNTDDARVRTMAYDIALGQQQQMGQMYALLESWDLSQVPGGEQMAWMADMEHDGMEGMDMSLGEDGLMPGMATDDELQELREAQGVDAERLWLELMIEHHVGGVDMAQAGLELAEDSQVEQLAWSMQRAQSAEIATMQQMLEDRGGA